MSTPHDRVARAVTALLVLAALALVLRPAAVLPERPLTEDAYYALAVSRNLAAGHAPTNDGRTHTNFYQPLFTFLCAPVYLVTGGALVGSLRGVLLLHWLVWVAAGLLAGDVAVQLVPAAQRDLARTWGRLAWLGSSYLFFQHFNGLETGLALLGWVAVARAWLAGWQEDLTGAVRLGALLGLLVLARIDGALLVTGCVALVALGPAPDRRDALRRAVVLGAVAVAVSSPWWLYNQLVFGALMPTSGTAQQAWELSVWRLFAGADAVFMAGAPMTSWPGLTGAIETMGWKSLRVAVTLGLLAGVWRAARHAAPDAPVASRLRSLLLAYGLAVAGLLVYYVYGSHATWHYPRYLSPLALPAVVGLGVLASGWTAPVRAVTALVLPLLLAAGLTDLFVWRQWAGSPFYRQQLGLVTAHVPSEAGLASWQTGTLSYFRPGVVNLDGKVNAEALRRAGDMPAYLDELGVDWLVDFPGNVQLGLGIGLVTDPIEAGWATVATDGPFTLYERVPSGGPDGAPQAEQEQAEAEDVR